MQLYFLSVITCLLSGLVLLSKKQTEEISIGDKKNLLEDVNKSLKESELFKNKNFELIVAIITFLVGVLKLFFVAKGGLIILGDLFPALMGITSGFAIFLHYFISTATTKPEFPSFIKIVFIDNIYWVGLASLIVAVVHFIMPGVIFF